MKKLIVGTAIIACMLMGSTAFAKDHDRDDHKGKGRERAEDRWDRDRDRGAHHRDVRWDRDHDRDRRPAGWDKGKKKGWGDCDVPPGQAKKHGCYDHDRRYRPTHRVAHRYPTRRPSGTWQRPTSTTTTTTTTRPTMTGDVRTWHPIATKQTTTTTTQTVPAQTNGTWHK